MANVNALPEILDMRNCFKIYQTLYDDNVNSVITDITRFLHIIPLCENEDFIGWLVERNGSGVELRTLEYENPGLNTVLRC